jgi:dTDP-4-dehydrorhamnose reductase
MRAVVFGAGGLLGQALVEHLPAGGHQVVGSFAGRKDGDIADAPLVAAALDRLRPEVVLNAAAWTDVDGAPTSCSTVSVKPLTTRP